MNLAKRIILFPYDKFRNLILYGLIGGFSSGTDFLVFYLLTVWGNLFYLVANALSIGVGITISFFLNKKYNFKVEDKVFRRFLIFISIGFGGLILSSGLLYLLVDVLCLEKIISKFMSVVFVVSIQFYLNKSVTFKKNHRER